MPYRDDHGAAQARAEQLERELATVRADNERLAAENEELRDRVDEHEAAGRALTVLAPSRGSDARSGVQAAAVVLGGWAVGAIGVGAAAWMLAPAILSAMAVGALVGARRRRPRAARNLVPTGLPIDRAAYGALLTAERASTVVRVEVRFVAPPSPFARSEILKQARGRMHGKWEGTLLVVTSSVLRTRDEQRRFDASPILRACDAIWDRLVVIHADHPIAAITPMARRDNAPARAGRRPRR